MRDFALEKLGDLYQGRLARSARHFGAVVSNLNIGSSLTDLRLASAEFENVQMTLDWATEHDDHEIPPGIMLAVYPLFHMRNAFDQCILRLEAAIEGYRQSCDKKKLARLLIALAVTRKLNGDAQGAWDTLDECEVLCEAFDVGTTCLLQMLERGALLLHTGDRAAAEQVFRRTLAGYEKTGETWWVAECLRALARIACEEGRLDEAQAHLDRALTLEQVPLQSWGVSNTLLEVGFLRRARGDTEGASEAFADSIRFCREVGDSPGLVRRLVALAECDRAIAQPESARLACNEAIALARRHSLDQVGRVTELLGRC